MTAEDVRAAMAVDPEFLQLADTLKERFGARLAWLKTAGVEIGQRIPVIWPDHLGESL